MEFLTEELAKKFAELNKLENVTITTFVDNKNTKYFDIFGAYGRYARGFLLTDFTLTRTASLVGSSQEMDNYKFYKFMYENCGDNWFNKMLNYEEKLHAKTIEDANGNADQIAGEEKAHEWTLRVLDEIKTHYGKTI